MKKSIFSHRRAISPIIATVLLIALVAVAGGIAAYVILNINEISFPQLEEKQSTNETVILTFYLDAINDTDADGKYDTITFKLSLDIDSPSIYIHDVDVILATGKTLDVVSPWMIISSSQSWNENMSGYYIPYGTINATFTIQNTDLSKNDAELLSGQTFSLLITYYYQVETGGYRLTTKIGFYETAFLKTP